jgi:protein KRI1
MSVQLLAPEQAPTASQRAVVGMPKPIKEEKLRGEKKATLFEDSGEDSEDAGEASFSINKRFADHFESSRRKRELARAKELGLIIDSRPEGSDGEAGDDSESSSEDEGFVAPETDLKIFQLIQAIKKKDPKVYDPSTAWFGEADVLGKPEEGSKSQKPQRQRAMDVIRGQVLAAAKEGKVDAFDSDEDEGEPEGHADSRHTRLDLAADEVQRKVYDSEQAAIRGKFLEAVRESATIAAEDRADNGHEEDWGGILSLKKQASKPSDSMGSWLAEASGLEAEGRERVSEFLESRPEDSAEAFLKAYMLTRKWEEDEDDDDAAGDDAEEEEGEDADALDAQDAYEKRFNFRFEEEGGTEIVGHPRTIEESVRRKESKRKEQREARKQRKAEEKQRAEEELRRLMNLKRAETKKQLSVIQDLAGDGVELAQIAKVVNLDEDFDPAEYDKQMKKLFNEEYYEGGDGDLETRGWELGEAERPEWAGGEDGFDEGGGVLGRKKFVSREEEEKERERLLQLAGSDIDDDDSEEAVGPAEEGQRSRKKDSKRSRGQKKTGQLMAKAAAALAEADGDVDRAADMAADELGYEDIIAGGLKTRFKYRKVQAQDWGLSTADILLATDKELNAYVSLKKLAPYREKEWEVSEWKQKKALSALRARIAKRMDEELPEDKAARSKRMDEELPEDKAARSKRGTRRASKRPREEEQAPLVESRGDDDVKEEHRGEEPKRVKQEFNDVKEEHRGEEPKRVKIDGKVRRGTRGSKSKKKKVQLSTGASIEAARLAAYGLSASDVKQ